MKQKYEIVVIEHFVKKGREKEIIAEFEIGNNKSTPMSLVQKAIAGYRVKFSDFMEVKSWEVLKNVKQTELMDADGKKIEREPVSKSVILVEQFLNKVELPKEIFIELEYVAVFMKKEDEHYETLFYEEGVKDSKAFTLDTIIAEGYLPTIDSVKIKSKRIKELRLNVIVCEFNAGKVKRKVQHTSITIKV